MSNSYTQLHIQFVFAVKYRQALICNEWKERLHQYITGIFRANNHKVLQINSMPDHIHIFIGNATASIGVFVGSEYQDGKQQMDKGTELLQNTIFMAGRLWCVFLFKKPC